MSAVHDSIGRLDFEQPVCELEEKIEELRRGGLTDESEEVVRLRSRLSDLEGRLYKNLSPWERVQLARHPKRPTSQDFITRIFDDFLELHGDRRFRDDPAVVAGIAKIDGRSLVVISQEKGRTTRERISRNFGMTSPEGFRKALRAMKTGEKFNLPIVSFVDTPGAYPGIGAEERGQPLAIAENLKEFFLVKSPIIVVIIGEGGSGGALAVAIGDRVIMMEHAIYSVISPEGCAAILWKSKERAPEAAQALRLTAGDCFELGVVDRLVEEVHGASHRDPDGNAKKIKEILIEELDSLMEVPIDTLIERRRRKFDSMGIFEEA
ncbi:MAG: acetyl-CoA carboxylase carboxyltransferase subunit alpha [bacterium]|nr:MAG: acetyl-CoA carboxylase carboxyltransferase subunit alpha [bacterium]